MKIYCIACKYAKCWEAYGGYAGYKCTKDYKLERNAIREWKVYKDGEKRNANNDCIDFVPSRWTRFVMWLNQSNRKETTK